MRGLHTLENRSLSLRGSPCNNSSGFEIRSWVKTGLERIAGKCFARIFPVTKERSCMAILLLLPAQSPVMSQAGNIRRTLDSVTPSPTMILA